MSDPITREETYLAALSGEAVSLPDPITRNEMYLAYLCGMDVNLPAPITRKDYFMYTLCQQGVGGGGVTIRNQDKTIAENGSYKADSGYTGLGTVTVAVSQEEPVVEPLEVTENGTYNPPDGVDGYAPVAVNVEASGGGDELTRAIVDRTVTEYNAPDDLTEIGQYAFAGCANLQSVSAANVTKLQAWAFRGSSKLSTALFPALTEVGGDVFYRCNLEEANFPYLKSAGPSTFYDNANLTKINTPLITSIPTSFLNSCKKIKTVDFPNATQISSSAFAGCSDLTNVNCPNAKNVGNSSFANCTSLAEITLPKLTLFDRNCFYGCTNLKTVRIGSSEIGCAINYVDNFKNCAAFDTLVLYSATVCTLGGTSNFDGTPFASGGTGGTVYVPAALISEYQQATNWSTLYAAGTCNFVAIEGSEYE